VGSEYMSRYEWALKVAKILNFDPNLIKDLTEDRDNSNSPPKPKRPNNLKLSNQKIIREMGVEFTPLSIALDEIRTKLLENIYLGESHV
jgi:dTDP-4-dehydrorhamnose reductase